MRYNDLKITPDEYVEGFKERYPQLAGFLRNATVREGQPLNNELASVRSTASGSDVVISPNFWRTYSRLGVETADFVFAHEIGHLVSDMDMWREKAEKEGISLTSNLPFNQPNAEEAFAETFAAIYTNHQASIKHLTEKYMNWALLVQQVYSKAKKELDNSTGKT